MHAQLVKDFLAEEVDAMNRDPHQRSRLDADVELSGSRVLVRASVSDAACLFCFDGPNFDAEPLSLQVLDPETLEPLHAERWPAGLGAGPHPSLGRPFSCLQGLYEYHCHVSHLDDPWDRNRDRYRLAEVVRVVLNKAGVAVE